ncbi:AAA family ATPase [Belnapia sp. T18]|uniref:AAA family ATPase n=1 Tax=Belnapia arida TaxID=2804533 RepID=A0ABS1U8R8_9PROT|nr:cellulose synthase operon protein YhjQ/BcsQ [Belnapia arida]MBL6081065.1 AAA family ATPase [Belnapia arida]
MSGNESSRIIAIASGKGGVGKTWLAISLAQALAEAGQRVLLVDADFGLANIDVQLGLPPGPDLGEVLAGRCGLGAAVRRHAAGFDLLPGRSGCGSLAGLGEAAAGRLGAMLREAAAAWDAVLLDCGAGIEPAVRGLAALADTLLVVATGEPTSLTDAYAVLKLHRRDRPAGDQRVVVNLAEDAAAGERVWRSLETACLRFLGAGVPLAGIVRRDQRVPEAIRHQAPLLTRHPLTSAAEDVRHLAAALNAVSPKKRKLHPVI